MNLNIGDIVYYDDAMVNYIGIIRNINKNEASLLWQGENMCEYTVFDKKYLVKITINDIQINIIEHCKKWFISPYIKKVDLKYLGKYLEDGDSLLTMRNHVWRKLNHYRDKILIS